MITVTKETIDLMKKLTEVTNGKVKVEMPDAYVTMSETGRFLQFGARVKGDTIIRFHGEDPKILEARND